MSQEPETTVVLKSVLARLKREFPGANLYEARLEFRLGERSDQLGRPEEYWQHTYWTIQVNNEHECFASLEQACTALRERLARKAQIPSLAERVAAVLRDVPEQGFGREEVVMAARAILEKERRGR